MESPTLKLRTGACDDVRIALGASAPTPMRAKKAERVLRGKKINNALLVKAGQTAMSEAKPKSDISASDEYRRELVNVMMKQIGGEAFALAKQA